jgi:hypothetical protein
VVCLACGLWLLLFVFFVSQELHSKSTLVFVLVGVLALQFLLLSFLSSSIARLRTALVSIVFVEREKKGTAVMQRRT